MLLHGRDGGKVGPGGVMSHEWEKVKDHAAHLREAGLLEPAKSDAHVCRKCHQLTMSEPGEKPDETLFGLVTDCDTSVVKHVLES